MVKVIILGILILGGIGVFLSPIFNHTKAHSHTGAIRPARRSRKPSSSQEPSIAEPTFSASSSATASTSAVSVTSANGASGYCLNVPVLYYHHIQPFAIAQAHKNTSLTVTNTIFDQQMQYLSSAGYNTLTAEQLVDALKNHTSLPPKSVVITLDDGYRDNYTYAFPLFKKYHLTANIMLATGLMEGSDYLTWPQISEMKQSGLLYYTDHTWSHYAVNHGTNDKIQFEIKTGQQQIQAHTGELTDVFTYPYGSYDKNSIALLQQDGFTGAFSTLPGKIQCDSFIMTLHRTRIGNAPLSFYGF